MASHAVQQARELLGAGKTEQARSLLLREAQRSPRDVETLSMLTFALIRAAQWEQARYYAERASALRPTDASLLVNLANVCAMSGSNDEAIAHYHRALQAAPGDRRAHTGLAGSYYLADRFADAVAQYRLASGGDPSASGPESVAMFAAALWQLGRADEAAVALRAAAAKWPESLALASRRAHVMLYADGASPEESFAAIAAHAGLLARASPERTLRFEAPMDPEKRLRVGIVCADLRAHASMWFLAPVLTQHDRDRVEFAAYHTAKQEDAVTDQYRPSAAVWRHVPEAGSEELRQRIIDDRVDVLLDLSGLTQGHRLPVFAMRAAPVQATYLAFPASTGLPTMDFRIVDSVTDPESLARFSTERLARIDPCLVCFTAPPGAPPVAPPPASGAGHVTFGCFAGLYKMNARLFEAWARLLARVPGSRLLLKHHGLAAADARADVAARLAGAGADPSRVDLEPPAPSAAELMATYARVDVSLDTFPYSGTTTTCESLFMGVPMVTMRGPASAGRVSESILRAVGLTDLVSSDADGYVEIATRLAGDAARRATLREELRARMLASAIGDQRAFAARFEGALREMWRWRCANPLPMAGTA